MKLKVTMHDRHPVQTKEVGVFDSVRIALNYLMGTVDGVEKELCEYFSDTTAWDLLSEHTLWDDVHIEPVEDK